MLLVNDHPEDVILVGNTLTAHSTGFISLSDWCSAVRTNSSATYEAFKNCRIAILEHRKYAGGTEHEFILARMDATGVESNRKYRRWVRVERTPKSIKELNLMKKLGRQKLVMWGLSLPAQDSLLITTSADDSNAAETYVLSTLDFSKVPTDYSPTIVDLAFLALTLSEIAESYDLYKFSCYWFARMIYEGFFEGNARFCGAVEKRSDVKTFKRRGKWNGASWVNDYGQLYREPRALRNLANCETTIPPSPDHVPLPSSPSPPTSERSISPPTNPGYSTAERSSVRLDAIDAKRPVKAIMQLFNNRVHFVYETLKAHSREQVHFFISVLFNSHLSSRLSGKKSRRATKMNLFNCEERRS